MKCGTLSSRTAAEESSRGVGGAASELFTIGADALTPRPGICAVNTPGSPGTANNARPVESVVTFLPPDISTTTLGNKRPAESSTASVAGKPATVACGSTIVRGAAACAL